MHLDFARVDPTSGVVIDFVDLSTEENIFKGTGLRVAIVHVNRLSDMDAMNLSARQKRMLTFALDAGCGFFVALLFH